MRAGGDDDMAGVPGVGIGDYTEPCASRPTRGGDLQNGGMRDDGRLEGGGVPFQMLDQLGRAQVAIGIGPGVAPTRQPGHPVRGEQVQGVPAFGAPALRHPTPIEYDVIASSVGQQPAHGQPGVARAHDDGVNAHHKEGCRLADEDHLPVTTLIMTGVGLVSTS